MRACGRAGGRAAGRPSGRGQPACRPAGRAGPGRAGAVRLCVRCARNVRCVRCVYAVPRDRFSVIPSRAVRCGALRCAAVRCGTLWCGASASASASAVQSGAAGCGPGWFRACEPCSPRHDSYWTERVLKCHLRVHKREFSQQMQQADAAYIARLRETPATNYDRYRLRVDNSHLWQEHRREKKMLSRSVNITDLSMGSSPEFA